jgi:hypothetical protein
MSASYLHFHLEIDNGTRLKTKLYDKHDDFTFPMINFPFRHNIIYIEDTGIKGLG